MSMFSCTKLVYFCSIYSHIHQNVSQHSPHHLKLCGENSSIYMGTLQRPTTKPPGFPGTTDLDRNASLASSNSILDPSTHPPLSFQQILHADFPLFPQKSLPGSHQPLDWVSDLVNKCSWSPASLKNIVSTPLKKEAKVFNWVIYRCHLYFFISDLTHSVSDKEIVIPWELSISKYAENVQQNLSLEKYRLKAQWWIISPLLGLLVFKIKEINNADEKLEKMQLLEGLQIRAALVEGNTKTSMVVCACSPSRRETEIGRPRSNSNSVS